MNPDRPSQPNAEWYLTLFAADEPRRQRLRDLQQTDPQVFEALGHGIAHLQAAMSDVEARPESYADVVVAGRARNERELIEMAVDYPHMFTRVSHVLEGERFQSLMTTFVQAPESVRQTLQAGEENPVFETFANALTPETGSEPEEFHQIMLTAVVKSDKFAQLMYQGKEYSRQIDGYFEGSTTREAREFIERAIGYPELTLLYFRRGQPHLSTGRTRTMGGIPSQHHRQQTSAGTGFEVN
jgi:hypothetical protein